MRFLAALPARITDRDDAIAVCAAFNGITREMITDFGEDASEIFHPFQDLYLAGLLGVVAVQQDGRARTYNLRFRRPTLYPIELRVRFSHRGGDSEAASRSGQVSSGEEFIEIVGSGNRHILSSFLPVD